ncbi:MAG: hypothetical protein SF069_08950 [Phycisphaerae bacterium]|nr:hypothetical protein [Phycisphaerae bacterium]
MRRAYGRWAVLGMTCLSTVGFATAAEEDANLGAMSRLREIAPQAKFFYSDAERLTRVYGQTMATGGSAEESAAKFRVEHAGVFGVAAGDLKPHSILEDRRATQGLMYDRETGEYKFTLVYFTQYHQDIEVYRSDLRVLTRNEPGFPVVLAASSLRELDGFQIPAERLPNLRSDGFIQSAFATAQQSALNNAPNLKNFTEPKLVIWAGVDDMKVEPRAALTFVGDDALVAGGYVNEKWLYVADAETGEILHQEDQILDVDISGTVSGVATEGSGSEQCGNEVPTPMPYARVTVGATTAFADVNGNFTIPNPGSTAVTVTSGVRGQYFRVADQVSGDPVLSQSVTPPGPVNFVHNAANTDERRRGEVNAYIHANRVRDYVLNVNPSYPTIGGQTEFTVTVNETGGICPGNAQYTGTSLRFCLSGGGQPNTAWTSVVYHEYGHHLVATGGSGQGAYGEGMGDVTSVLLLDESGIGFGFFGPCAQPLRNASNSCTFSASTCSSCGSAIHTCGQLISGAVWETRNELAITHPLTYRQIISDLALNSILLHTGTSIASDITIDFLTLDDNDADISNGTPNFQAICTGFGEKGLPCPPLDPIGFVYPGGRPDTIAPNQPFVISVNATALTDSPVPGTGQLSYRIGSSGPFTTVSMTQTSPNNYQATLPATPCPQTIEYYFSVQSVASGVVRNPENAPTSVYRAVAANGTITNVEYNFQTNPGWTVNTTATDGGWDTNPAVPVGGCNRGNPQADFDGSGQCWMTDNSAANACNSDVDGGATTLTSQVFNLSGLAAPSVTYARWFSNNTGGGPETDTLRVEISTNGGTNWSVLETVGPTSTSPNPEIAGGWFVKTYPIPNSAQFRIRFVTEDVGTASVVEAAIDAFEIFDLDCSTTFVLGDMNCDGIVSVGDIAGFVLALTDPAGYASAFPACNINNGDINADSVVSVGDIAGFVALLTGGN